MTVDVDAGTAGRAAAAQPAAVLDPSAPAWRVVVAARSSPLTPVAVLEDLVEVEMLDELDGPGSGSVTVHAADPDAAALQLDRVVRLEVDGVTAGAMIVREVEQQTVSQDEEAGRLLRASGPGLRGLLDEAVVYPAVGLARRVPIDERVFGWPAVDYPHEASWPYAVALEPVGSGPVWQLPGGVPIPTDWPVTVDVWGAAAPWWIWGSPGSSSDAPPGVCYVRRSWLCETPGMHRIYVAADNILDLYVDGDLLIRRRTDFSRTTYVDVDLDEGVHVIAARIQNWADDPPPGGNPGGLLAAVMLVDQQGVEVALGDSTQGVGSPAPPEGRWRAIAYPSVEPGVTVGWMLRRLITEAQDRGAIPEITPTWTSVRDSDGRRWPTVPIITTRVGQTIGEVIEELTDLDLVEVQVDGRLRMHAWMPGGRGSGTGPSWSTPTDPDDPSSGSLLELTYREAG